MSEHPEPSYEYVVSMAPHWRDVPFEELPRGLQRLVERKAAEQESNEI